MFNLYHWAMRRWGSLVLIAIASNLLCPPLLIRWTDCVGLVYRFSQMEHWSAHQGVPSQSHTIVHSTCLQSILEVMGSIGHTTVPCLQYWSEGKGYWPEQNVHTLMRNAMVGSRKTTDQRSHVFLASRIHMGMGLFWKSKTQYRDAKTTLNSTDAKLSLKISTKFAYV